MIDKFVNDLASNFNNFEKVENIYADTFEYSEITKNNLSLYLKKMYKLKPDYIIVGEAPGYKGCRWSGIPFTSERNIKENSFFGLNNGFKIRNPQKPESEKSATRVWRCLDNLNVLPLIWNAFPFHPYRAGNKNSNRTPTTKELEIGKNILKELIKIFEIDSKHIVPIGNKAAAILKDYGIKKTICHPAARGEKSKYFDIDMKEVFAK